MQDALRALEMPRFTRRYPVVLETLMKQMLSMVHVSTSAAGTDDAAASSTSSTTSALVLIVQQPTTLAALAVPIELTVQATPSHTACQTPDPAPAGSCRADLSMAALVATMQVLLV
jgi:hypothetical protein